MSRSSASYISAALAKYAAPPGTPSIGAPASASRPPQPKPQDPYAEFNRQAELFKPKPIGSAGPLKPSALPQPKPAEQLTKITPNPTGGTISLNTPTMSATPVTVTSNSSGAISPAGPQSPTVPTTSGPATPVTPDPAVTPGGAWANVAPGSGPARPHAGTVYPAGGAQSGPRTNKFDTFAKDMIATGKQPEGAVIDMTQPVDNDFVAKQISDEKIPIEQRQSIAKLFVQDHVKQNPMLMEGLQDIQAGKTDTEAARAFMAKLEAQKAAYIEAHPQEAATPQGFGQLMQQWEAMPFASKAMMGIGLPLGIVGVMSSLFGEGGMGMGILGLLGLGAAGLGGAAGGMFGEGAQNMVGDAAFNLGQFTGMIPEKADLSRLTADDPIGMGGGTPLMTREQAGAEVASSKQQLDQLKQLMGLPIPDAEKIRWMQKLDPSINTPELANKAFQNAQMLVQQYGAADSDLNKKLQQGSDYANSAGISGFLQENIAVPWMNYWNPATKKGAYKFAFNAMDAKELADLKAEQTKKYDVDNARRVHELEKRKQVSAPVPKAKKTVIVVACQKAAQEKDMNLEYVFKKWASDHLYSEPDYVASLSPEKYKAFDGFWTDNDGYGQIIAATRKLNKNRKPGDVDPRESGAGYMTYDNINRLMQANMLPVNEQFTLDDWKKLYAPPVKAAASELITKAARCWAGYEPVPGAKAYSRGSCRPKGPKKTQNEMKKQSTEGTPYGHTSHLYQSSKPG